MNNPVTLAQDQTLRFAKQYKLQWEPAQNAFVLLYPEGLVKLTDSAGEILKRIDGKTSALEIVSSLEAAFPGADLKQDVLDFLQHAHGKGWIQHD